MRAYASINEIRENWEKKSCVVLRLGFWELNGTFCINGS